MNKKIMSLVLAAGVMLSLAGCGTKTSNVTTDGDVPVIKIFSSSIVGREANGELKQSDEMFYEHLEEKFGVKITTEIPPVANYKERLQIMLAGGEYPDLIAFTDHNDPAFISAVNSGIIEPINEYLDLMPNLKKYTSDFTFESLKVKGDDSIYAIPRSSLMRADGFAVREDWLNKIGMSIPEDGKITLDQLTEMLRKFTFDDPDGNGMKDTYGVMAFQDANGNFELPFTYPFGVCGWQEHDGQYKYMDEKYCLEHSNYKNALEYANMLYEEGLMDPDSLTMKVNAAKDRYKKGIEGVVTEFVGALPDYENALKLNNPDAKIGYISSIEGPEGYSEGTMFGAGYYWCLALTKDSANKEKICQMIDYMLSDEGWEIVKYGFEGVNYEIVDGKKQPLYNENGTQISANASKLFVRRNDDRDFYVPTNMPDTKTPSIEMRDKWLEQCIENFKPSLDLGYQPQSASGIINANKKLTQVISKIVVGELEVSAYDEALREWYASGGEKYIQEMNDYIALQQK